jgi:hypothetical protein
MNTYNDSLKNHPELDMDNSMTPREFREPNNLQTLDKNAPPLSKDELIDAYKTQVVSDYVRKFPRNEKFYADPIDSKIPNQIMGLFSFIPSPGATPDKNGIYGMAKLRGNYSSLEEMDERAKVILRDIDSYHKLYYTYVGRPFPCTVDSRYSQEKTEIDIRKDTTEIISKDIKQQKAKDQKEIDEIKERTEELYSDTNKLLDDIDPYDQYITLKVKRSQLKFTYLEHKKKMKEIEEILVKTNKELTELDESHPDFKDNFYNKYMDARRKAGLKDTDESFIQYMCDDLEDLPF